MPSLAIWVSTNLLSTKGRCRCTLDLAEAGGVGGADEVGTVLYCTRHFERISVRTSGQCDDVGPHQCICLCTRRNTFISPRGQFSRKMEEKKKKEEKKKDSFPKRLVQGKRGKKSKAAGVVARKIRPGQRRRLRNGISCNLFPAETDSLVNHLIHKILTRPDNPSPLSTTLVIYTCESFRTVLPCPFSPSSKGSGRLSVG